MAGLDGLSQNPPPVKPGKSDTPTSPRLIRVLVFFATLVLLAVFVFGSGFLYKRSLSSNRTIPGLLVVGEPMGALTPNQLKKAARRLVARLSAKKLVLRFRGHQTQVPLAELGISIDETALLAELNKVGKRGVFIDDVQTRLRARRGRLEVGAPLQLDRRKARAFFMRLKKRIDRAATKTVLDLEHRKIVRGRTGFRLRVYDALAAAENAVRAGKLSIALPVTVIEPSGDRRFDKLDISHVLGTFTTVYSQADKHKHRAHNLKVGAAKIDALVLEPGESFSYNKVVGPRNRAQGYRVAPVISQGELVDGMAGGSCQLSSTLFAAAFFAGLDLESSRPHSIPSSYIKMGLDATVAYPSTDLVLKNPYPFSVVVHFVVGRGKVTVRLLGKKRPYERVEFRRVLKKQTAFKSVERKDPSLPKGVRIVAQRGVPGFLIERQRLFYSPSSKKPVKIEKRELRYPPTTEFVKVGTGKPDPNFKLPKPKKPFGDVKPEYSQSQ
jgi:vancomycin resistance protein YoaR